jgi:hypothetical protein
MAHCFEEIKKYFESAIKFFEEGRALIDKDPAQASEKLYRSVEEIIKGLAMYYGLRDILDRVGERDRWSTKDLDEAVIKISERLGDWFRRAWETAYYLHVEGFHEASLDQGAVRARIDDIEKVIEETKRIIQQTAKEQAF